MLADRISARLSTLLPQSPAVRALIASTLVGSVARGLFITLSVIFFTRSVGLSPYEVGIGLTVAALCALVVNVPAGHLADVVGPRSVTVASGVARALVLLGYLIVAGFGGFLVVVILGSVLEAANGTARSALIAGAVPREHQVRSRAILRSVTNVGWAVGSAGAALALHADDRGTYVVMIWICAAASLFSNLLVLRVPRVAASRHDGGGARFTALRDRPYVALTVLNGALCVHYGILNVALPLWVVERTAAPAWVVAATLFLNACTVALFQVRASRRSAEAAGAGLAQRLAGFLLLGACLLYALAAGQPAWVAAAVLIAGAVVHVLGEMQQAAGGWGIAFDLAPTHAQGQYQGLYGMGFGLANMIAPALLTAVVIGWGWPGWLLVGLIFAGSGALVPVAVRWALRTRPAVAAIMAPVGDRDGRLTPGQSLPASSA